MLFWIISSVTFLLLRIPSMFEPYWYGDEGIYLTLGQAIRSGLTLYTQIHDNKPPTLYYLAALSQTVFGFRLLLLVWMIPTIAIFYKLSQKFLTKKISQVSTFLFLVATSIPFFEGNIANAEIFMLLPTLLAFYYLFSSIHKSYFAFLISGLLLGFAFTIKVPVAIEFGFLFLYTLFFIPKNKIRNLLIFGFSFIVPTIIFAVYFYFKGALNNFLYAALFQNFGYLSSWSTGTQSSSATSGGLPIRLAFLVASWVILYFLKLKKIISLQTFFLYGWFFSTIFGVLLSTRPYPHYLIQLLPPFCLIIVSSIAKPINLTALFVLLIVVVKYKFYFYPIMSYYQNFYLNHNQKNYFSHRVVDIYQISDHIRQNTSSSDRIFVWGDEPYIYPLSQRLPATKFTTAYHIIDFNGYDLTLSQLKTYLPKYIVYFPMNNRPFDSLDKFVSKYYYAEKSINDAVIFHLR